MADAPKVRLNLAVMLQEANLQSAEYNFRRLCSMPVMPADMRAMASVIFGAFLESNIGSNSRLGGAVMYQASSTPGSKAWHTCGSAQS